MSMSDPDREHHARYCYLCEDMQIRLSVSEDAEGEVTRLHRALEEVDQALNSGDQDYAIVGAADIVRAALAPQCAALEDGRECAQLGHRFGGVDGRWEEEERTITEDEIRDWIEHGKEPDERVVVLPIGVDWAPPPEYTDDDEAERYGGKERAPGC